MILVFLSKESHQINMWKCGSNQNQKLTNFFQFLGTLPNYRRLRKLALLSALLHQLRDGNCVFNLFTVLHFVSIEHRNYMTDRKSLKLLFETSIKE